MVRNSSLALALIFPRVKLPLLRKASDVPVFALKKERQKNMHAYFKFHIGSTTLGTADEHTLHGTNTVETHQENLLHMSTWPLKAYTPQTEGALIHALRECCWVFLQA